MYFSIKLQGSRKGKKAVLAATRAGLMESWTLALGAWEPLSCVTRSECLLFPSPVICAVVTQLFSVFAYIAQAECLCMYPCFSPQEKKNLSWLISVHQGACFAQSFCLQPHRLLAIKQTPAFSLGTHSWCDQVWPLQWGQSFRAVLLKL